jgi:hypothetical protein
MCFEIIVRDGPSSVDHWFVDNFETAIAELGRSSFFLQPGQTVEIVDGDSGRSKLFRLEVARRSATSSPRFEDLLQPS